MLISAISSMSVRSRAFRFVDFDQLQVDVNSLQNLIGFTDDFLVPNYYIRGAITQLDQGVIANSAGASIAGSAFSLGFSADQVTSVVSMDLNIGDLLTRQILPGISARNSISVTVTGRAGDAGGRIDEYLRPVPQHRPQPRRGHARGGAQPGRAEHHRGAGQADRGPLLALPADRADQPGGRGAGAPMRFDAMSEREQVAFVQQALASQGLYDAPITGVRDEATKGAVPPYQADMA